MCCFNCWFNGEKKFICSVDFGGVVGGVVGGGCGVVGGGCGGAAEPVVARLGELDSFWAFCCALNWTLMEHDLVFDC